jgi:hypothetical protein
MVFVVLYAIFVCVFLKSFAIILVSLPMYVNTAHFSFLAVFVVDLLFCFLLLLMCKCCG